MLLIFARLVHGKPSFAFKIINAVTFCMFFYDKYQGIRKGYRVAENVLFIASLFGGWIGGACAMLIFKHKNLKRSFILKMIAIAIINILVAVHFGK